jgi:hypothetical protein
MNKNRGVKKSDKKGKLMHENILKPVIRITAGYKSNYHSIRILERIKDYSATNVHINQYFILPNHCNSITSHYLDQNGYPNTRFDHREYENGREQHTILFNEDDVSETMSTDTSTISRSAYESKSEKETLDDSCTDEAIDTCLMERIVKDGENKIIVHRNAIQSHMETYELQNHIELSNNMLCSVCQTNPKNTIHMPCMHSTVCVHCVAGMFSRFYKKRECEEDDYAISCLICKKRCDKIMKVYL